MCSEDWYPLVLQTAVPHQCLSYTHTHLSHRLPPHLVASSTARLPRNDIVTATLITQSNTCSHVCRHRRHCHNFLLAATRQRSSLRRTPHRGACAGARNVISGGGHGRRCAPPSPPRLATCPLNNVLIVTSLLSLMPMHFCPGNASPVDRQRPHAPTTQWHTHHLRHPSPPLLPHQHRSIPAAATATLTTRRAGPVTPPPRQRHGTPAAATTAALSPHRCQSASTLTTLWHTTAPCHPPSPTMPIGRWRCATANAPTTPGKSPACARYHPVGVALPPPTPKPPMPMLTPTDVPTRPQRQHCHRCPANAPPTRHCTMVLPLTPRKCAAPPPPRHLGPAPMPYHPRAAVDALLMPTPTPARIGGCRSPPNAQPPSQQCSSANVPLPTVMPTSVLASRQLYK